MQIRTATAIGLSALLITLVSFSSEGQDKPIKIGYVDLKRVYEESGKKEEYDERIKEIRREKDLALIEMKDKISAMEKTMLELSDAKRREKEVEIKQLKLEFDEYRKDATRDLNRKMMEYEREFALELKEIVTEMGDEEGYTYIISDVVLLYSDPKNDLTEKVIAVFDKRSVDKLGKSSSKGE
jgi:outer membrane protein